MLVRELFPLATVVTPNLDEAGWLIGRQIADASAMEQAAQDLLALGAQQVLLKGGHLPGEWVVDVLAGRDGLRKELGSQRIHTHNGHGTGCTLSSAIAAHMALGLELAGRGGKCAHLHPWGDRLGCRGTHRAGAWPLEPWVCPRAPSDFEGLSRTGIALAAINK